MTEHTTEPELTIQQPSSELIWSRLSPVAIVFYLLKILKIVFNNLLPSLAPLVVLLINSDSKIKLIGLIVVAVSSLILLASVLQYWFFRYCLDGQRILIDQGVFKRQHRVIPFERVQNININQSLYFRPFKLVSLMLDTAGSNNDEGNLAGISVEQAQAIRDQILQTQQQQKSAAHAVTTNTDTIDNQADQSDKILATASIGDIVRYGLSNNGMYLVLALIAPLFPRIDNIISQWLTKAEFQKVTDLLGGPLFGGIIIVALVIAAIFLTLIIISVVGSLLRFYGYRLSLKDRTLRSHSGLINTHEEALNLSKIQAIVRSCNFIGHWLKRENLICRQTSNGGNKARQKARLFIVPARTAHACEELLSTLYPDCPHDIETHPINRRYIRKTLLLKFVLPALIISIPLIYLNSWWFLLIWLVPLLFYPLIVKRWRQYRYGLNHQYGVIRSGFIGHRLVTFPLFKVQRVEISQSPIQQRRELSTLTIYLASGRLCIPYMPIQDAQQWFDLIYYQVETDPRPWF